MAKVHFPAPDAAVSLYRGEVMHARLKPFGHRFSYRVFSLLLDLDRLSEAGRQSMVFSVGRFNLLSFAPSDHGPRDGSDLRLHVESRLASAGCPRPARILLLCYPRILGFTFNPLSVYYCYDKAGDLTALVYEVRNTVGGMQHYVLPVAAGMLDEAGVRQEQAKAFYVSPFLDMDLRYRFRMWPPGDKVTIRILECDRQGPILAATFHGLRTDATTTSLVMACIAMPFLTLKVVAAILWQALKLWIKGAKFRPSPPPAAGDRTTAHKTYGATR